MGVGRPGNVQQQQPSRSVLREGQPALWGPFWVNCPSFVIARSSSPLQQTKKRHGNAPRITQQALDWIAAMLQDRPPCG